jgi:hypothetical protein
MLAIEGACDSVHQDREGGPAPQTTRLPEREDPLDPAIALRVVGAGVSADLLHGFGQFKVLVQVPKLE